MLLEHYTTSRTFLPFSLSLFLSLGTHGGYFCCVFPRMCVCELKISLCCKLTPQTPLSDCALCVCVCAVCTGVRAYKLSFKS